MPRYRYSLKDKLKEFGKIIPGFRDKTINQVESPAFIN